MSKLLATLLAFAIAPLVAAVCLLVAGAVRSDSGLLERSAILWGAVFYCYTLVATLVIGLPVYLLLDHFNKVTWWSAVLVGMLGGSVMTVVFAPPNILFTLIGGLSGFVFWLIWRQGH